MLYTEADSPVIMENVVDRHTMVGADKNRTRGIISMLRVFPNPPRAGGVKVVRIIMRT